ncbi:hypothetical protein CRG98_013874 [Punica granatum]|uniref:Uncharacterized protein n=1 Tax=Punica granatum TaxID=22663 RepID=A0A2I0KB24_PUNGR|nr:hypothetical protein CRG98_013874 [Punica granatum]
MGGEGSHGGGFQQLQRILSTVEKSTSDSSVGDGINLCACGRRLLMQTSTKEQSYGSSELVGAVEVGAGCLLGGGLYVREEEAVIICVGGLKGVILRATLKGAGGLHKGVILAGIPIPELNCPMPI